MYRHMHTDIEKKAEKKKKKKQTKRERERANERKGILESTEYQLDGRYSNKIL